jgi:hypothetical protein
MAIIAVLIGLVLKRKVLWTATGNAPLNSAIQLLAEWFADAPLDIRQKIARFPGVASDASPSALAAKFVVKMPERGRAVKLAFIALITDGSLAQDRRRNYPCFVEPPDLLIQDEAQTFGRPNQLFGINLGRHVHILQGGDHQQPPGASTDPGMHLLMESLAADAPGLRSPMLTFLSPCRWQAEYIRILGISDELATPDPWTSFGAAATADPAWAHVLRVAELAASTQTSATLPQPTSVCEFLGGNLSGSNTRPQQLLILT